MALLAIIMAALTVFAITVTNSTSYQRQRQGAIQLATTQLDLIRGMTPADLEVGRRLTDVTAQFAGAPAAVSPWLTAMTPAVDLTATAAQPAALPVTTTATVNSTVMTATTYLGFCALASGGTGSECTKPVSGAGDTGTLRAVVAVTWPGGRCPAGTCTYTTATLVSTAADPVFALNQAPPPAPAVTVPNNQTTVVGDTVSLQLAMPAGAGVDPATWQATGLPAGLAISTTGLVTGRPTSPGPAAPVQVTVTDAFLRTATGGFTWTVVPPVAAQTLANQTSVVGTAIGALTLAATGGTGAPFTWTDPGKTLPAGLVLSSTGTVTGTPTGPGTAAVRLTVTDAGGRSATLAFTWTTDYPPLAATGANQNSTVGTAITALTLTATGGSGGYVWTDPTTSLPPGLGISPAGVVSGTPSAAVTAKPVELLVTDAKAGSTVKVSLTWTVLAPVTAQAPGNQTSTAGTAIAALTLTATGGSSTYTWADPSATLPPGLGISPAGVVSGTPTAAGTAAVRLTVTDSGGRTATVTFTWTVLTPVTAQAPGNQTSTVGTAITALTLTASGGSGGYTWTDPGATLPPGLGISPAGIVSGTPTAAGTAAVRLTVTDSGGRTATVTFTWTVLTPVTAQAPGNQTSTVGTAITALTLTATGGSGGYTWTDPSRTLPAGLALSPTGTVTGTPTTAGSATVRLTVTDSGGRTAPPTFTWTVDPRCSAAAQAAYANAVTLDNPSLWYRLGEPSGTTAVDAGSARRNGSYVGSPVLGRPGALNCSPDTAVMFNGSTTEVTTSTAAAVPAPSTFSVEAWFATTVGGGKLIGFGNSQSGTSSQYDRQVYLTNSGQVVFGLYVSGYRIAASPGTYLDGKYHHVVATLSGAGMVLYVDGVKVAANATTTTAESNTGWWRVGYDNLSGWPGAPTRTHFTGLLDEVAVYPTALSATRVAAHYNADR
jgi:hypothetical protein